jgi:hypothetical protein
LRRAEPAAPIRVVSRPRTLDALEALQDRVQAAGAQLGAPVAYTSVAARANLVEVALEDLNHPASRELRAQFAGAPIRWIRDTVTAC